MGEAFVGAQAVNSSSRKLFIRASNRTGGVGLCSALLLALCLIPFDFAAQAVTAGYRDFNYGTASLPFPTGNKAESKLWWNDGSWWGALWSPTANAWHIYQLDPAAQKWNDTGTAIDNQRSLVDCLWEGASEKLYVTDHVFTETGSSTTSTSLWGRLIDLPTAPRRAATRSTPDFR